MQKTKDAGFTLIELAIVLVVIGLIIAAVLKGEDLIQNARMLNFVTNPVQKTQVAAMAYYDRTGQFPSVSTTTARGPLYQMYQAGINGVLNTDNPFTKGSTQLAIAAGNFIMNGNSYPAMFIKQVTVDASGAPSIAKWTRSGLGYVEYLKSRIDGSTNSWTTGAIRVIKKNVAPTYTSLSSEINNTSVSTTAYDGYIAGGSYDAGTTTNSVLFINPTTTSNNLVGSQDTVVYFYNNAP